MLLKIVGFRAQLTLKAMRSSPKMWFSVILGKEKQGLCVLVSCEQKQTKREDICSSFLILPVQVTITSSLQFLTLVNGDNLRYY